MLMRLNTYSSCYGQVQMKEQKAKAHRYNRNVSPFYEITSGSTELTDITYSIGVFGKKMAILDLTDLKLFEIRSFLLNTKGFWLHFFPKLNCSVSFLKHPRSHDPFCNIQIVQVILFPAVLKWRRGLRVVTVK